MVRGLWFLFDRKSNLENVSKLQVLSIVASFVCNILLLERACPLGQARAAIGYFVYNRNWRVIYYHRV